MKFEVGLMLGVLSLGFPSRMSGADWPQWRGPNRDGIAVEKNWSAQWPPEGPKQLWKAKVGIGWSSMSVVGGRLYSMGNTDETDTVYCLDANTGAEIWKHSYPCSSQDPNGYPGPRCTPTVDGNRVYTVSREGHVFCLDAATGKVIWQKHYQSDFGGKVPTWGFTGSPWVEGNLLILEPGGPGAAAIALNKTNGSVVWKSGNDTAGYSSPIGFGSPAQRAVAVFHAKAIGAYNLRDGRLLWRHPWETPYDVNAATPVFSGDKVFISSGYNRGGALLQFGAGPPRVLWENRNMRNHMNSCVLLGSHLYGFDENELKCMELLTGKILWSERKYGKGSLIAADDKLILLGDRGLLGVARATPAGYQELSSAQVLGGRDIWAPPVLAHGKIYCRSKSDLVCVDVGKK